jgi:hypothetical protein
MAPAGTPKRRIGIRVRAEALCIGGSTIRNRRCYHCATFLRIGRSPPPNRTMDSNAFGFDAQVRGWRTLHSLHPLPIDLARIDLVRECSPADLSEPDFLEDLVQRLGLNDEALSEFPAELRPFCGHGLRIWQYPIQFGKYLARISSLGVRSYVEIGIRHGGSFVATVEVLERFGPLDFALGVDIIPCPAITRYAIVNPRARFECVNTKSAPFEALLDRLGSIDLVFIDSHHEEAQCRKELSLVSARANMVALHDVCNIGCPDVGKVWRDLRADATFECFEYVDQYAGMGPYMGIGLAVKKRRLAEGVRRETR